MGKKSKRKGYGYEIEVRDFFRAHFDPDAFRTPLSGALGGDLHGDIRACIYGQELAIQCKRRKSPVKFIEAELEDHDALVYRADHCESVIIMKASTLARIFSARSDHDEN